MPQLQAADRDLLAPTVRASTLEVRVSGQSAGQIFRASYRVTQRLRCARCRRRWAPALAREGDWRPLESPSPGSRRSRQCFGTPDARQFEHAAATSCQCRRPAPPAQPRSRASRGVVRAGHSGVLRGRNWQPASREPGDRRRCRVARVAAQSPDPGTVHRCRKRVRSFVAMTSAGTTGPTLTWMLFGAGGQGRNGAMQSTNAADSKFSIHFLS